MGLLHQAVMRTLPLVPTPVMRRLSARYIAGETLEEALAALDRFRAAGFAGVLDVLGEDVADEAEARGVVDTYAAAAARIEAAGLDAYVSVKPTHLGLRLGEDLALELYRELCRRCLELGQFVRVEMEDHTTTDATLRIYAALRAEFEHVGVVLQSRLFRTPADIAALPPSSQVRLVKGIYLEPGAIAHTEPGPIREAFRTQAAQLLDAGHSVSFATHDEELGDGLLAECQQRGLPPERYEFQVLMGVQERLWSKWRDAGAKVRAYVPYGPQWRAYSTRRLRKNPQILGHVVRATLGLS